MPLVLLVFKRNSDYNDSLSHLIYYKYSISQYYKCIYYSLFTFIIINNIATSYEKLCFICLDAVFKEFGHSLHFYLSADWHKGLFIQNANANAAWRR